MTIRTHDTWYSRAAPHWRLGLGLAGLLAATGLALTSRAVDAQGNAAALLRQMEARMAALSDTAQRLNAQLNSERQMRTRQQLQMANANQQLQRLQKALNDLAATGDPLAKAARSSNPQAALDKLIGQLEARARTARGGSPTTGSEESLAADLSGARLSGAALRATRLPKANLKGADLRNADLTNAALPGALLQSTQLQGAILTGVDLTNADLKGVLYDEHTRWPDGLDPQKRGALLVR